VKTMRLMIDDAPVKDVKVALAKEHHDREQTIRALMAKGRCSVVQDNCATHITVRVDTEHFTDIREKFPTTILMANIQLALAAGLDDRNRKGDPYDEMSNHLHDAMAYGIQSVYRGGRSVGKSEVLAMGYDAPVWTDFALGDYLYNAEPAVTVTVKQKFKKGLRP